MAARKQRWHPDQVRKRIQASQLINRLRDHVNSDKPLMDSTQVQAARILLDRVLPALSTTTLQGDAEHPLQTRLTVSWEAVDAPSTAQRIKNYDPAKAIEYDPTDKVS